MRLGTANIRNFPDMEPWKVDRDTVTCAKNTSLCGLQEIQVGEDTKVVRDALPDGWTMVGADTTSPIILDSRKWKVLDSSSQRIKRPKLSRVENPYLDLVSVTVRSVKRPQLEAFAVANTHLVSGGYNAQHLPDVRHQWDLEWRLFQGLVHRLRRPGLTVFPLGDLNRHQPPKMMPRPHFHWLTPTEATREHRGEPDHVGQLVHWRSVRLHPGLHSSVVLHSDHKLHVITGPLSHANE